MLFTIDQINPELWGSYGFTIGAHILDDCDKDTYGLEQAVAFIKGKFFVIVLVDPFLRSWNFWLSVHHETTLGRPP